MGGDSVNVLVTSTREVNDNNLFLIHGRCQLGGIRQRMARLQGWNNTFGPSQGMERGQCLTVVGSHVLGAARIF